LRLFIRYRLGGHIESGKCQVTVVMKVKTICNRTLSNVDHVDEKYSLAISTLVAGEMLL
jgi:uncharacterized 2Fe-2S/4Fe-4S cluster protein (DUF4445 family)